ncbi:hypothetical protein ACEWY4_015895 [Coilia grayii]|uniref:Peptidase M12B domain-containing protein n=1 Tax=Coilia grayii TaxID=363190 RepID=A0ABD1JQ75_9TELE
MSAVLSVDAGPMCLLWFPGIHTGVPIVPGPTAACGEFIVSGDPRLWRICIAYLGGACSSKRKCVLAEDNGLNLAFTIAHELGHNMGMSHDDDHATCTGHSHIMSGEWVKGRNPSDLSWSSCSRDDLENFLSLPSFSHKPLSCGPLVSYSKPLQPTTPDAPSLPSSTLCPAYHIRRLPAVARSQKRGSSHIFTHHSLGL